MKSPPLCKDCVHASPAQEYVDALPHRVWYFARCTRTKFLLGSEHLVAGEHIFSDGRFCSDERSGFLSSLLLNSCGQRGRHFKAKEPS